MEITKQQIIEARKLNVIGMMDIGFTLDELYAMGEVGREYYSPSDSYEYFDGETFYNVSGQQLTDPSNYDTSSEGYTPFGDE